MGGEQVSSLPPVEGSELNDSAPLITYTEQFYNHFPFYLSIGMTYEQYWEGHSDLVKYYRKANEINNDKKNQELWLQGMYIYDAIYRLTPVLHAFAKAGTKAEPYMDKPYPLTADKAKEHKEEREEANLKAMMAKFGAVASAVNSKFRGQSEVNSDGDRDRSITD